MWTRTHAPLPLVDPDKLQFCIQNRLNVLLEGRHGVGKTTIVKSAFERAGLNLLVFSGATMDPWVDFVGVPRPVTREDGKTVLELIRRPEFVDDSVDAIFIDEFNRAPVKVRNAALELLQFQSVNGHRFPRLRAVWVAINPARDDYDADQLDPAQRDRFHVHIEVPYRPCPEYIITQYGSAGRAALEWWDAQTEEARRKISPRRLEYAVRVAQMGGPLRDVLPSDSNVKRLIQMLEDGPIFDTLKALLDKGDRVAARALLEDPATGSHVIGHILGSQAATLFYLPLLAPERLMGLLDNAKVLETVVRYSDNIAEFRNVMLLALSGKEGSPLARRTLALTKLHRITVPSSAQPALVSADPVLDDTTAQKLDPYGRLTG